MGFTELLYTNGRKAIAHRPYRFKHRLSAQAHELWSHGAKLRNFTHRRSSRKSTSRALY